MILKRLVVLVLLLALAIAGCGGTDAETAPGFSLESAGGATVALEDYSGTPVLLFFHMADG